MRREYWPLLAYLLVALVYTYPLILHPITQIPGNNGDSYINMWPFWYFPHALLNGLDSIFEPTLQLFPDGISLIYTSNSAIGAVVMAPLSVMVSPAAALNCWLLLHLWLGGWFFSRFCKVLGAGTSGAFLGGLAYMCSPFVAVHLPGHYTLVQIGFTAGALYSLAVLMDRCVGGLVGWRHWVGPAVGLGISTWAVAVTDFYLAVMTIMLLLPAVVASFVVRPGGAKVLTAPGLYKGLGLAMALCIVLVLPWVQLVVSARNQHDYAAHALEGFSSLVARWSRLVNLPKYHPVWSQLLYDWTGDKISQFNEYTYLGIIGLLIMTMGVVLGPLRRRLVVWVIAFLIALGLAGGNGYTYDPEWMGTPLGFGVWWPKFFPFSEFRVPGRWQFAVCAVMAVGVALSADDIIGKINSAFKRRIMFAALLAILAFDLLRWPLPLCKAEAIRSGLDGASTGTVLDVPVGIISGQGYSVGRYENETLLRQMSHRRPVLSTSVARLPMDIISARRADAELTEFLRVQGGGELTTGSKRLGWEGFARRYEERLGWETFARRYEVETIRIPKEWPTSAGLMMLGEQMNPDWDWYDDGEAVIGR